MMKVLALSSSRVGGGGFLEKAVPMILEFIGKKPLNIAFVPFASVQKDYEAYGNMVKQAFETLLHTINTVIPGNAKEVLQDADVIMIGGGNTFKLLHDIYDQDLFDIIVNKIKKGAPYIGWSAGANLAGRSISTTNDMPITQPRSFTSFGFFPFQINPHYVNLIVEGHHGETRDQRIEEFVTLNPGVPVVGLPEGTTLRMESTVLNFIGEKDGMLFQVEAGEPIQKRAILKGEDISFLLAMTE
ncbi:MAG TPA: dipeptidase PepE [Flavisolibacter sp.]|jgi:dipeptidase E|nr:dipeptidase PepE [Flavisolibacter sp.]